MSDYSSWMAPAFHPPHYSSTSRSPPVRTVPPNHQLSHRPDHRPSLQPNSSNPIFTQHQHEAWDFVEQEDCVVAKMETVKQTSISHLGRRKKTLFCDAYANHGSEFLLIL